MTSGASEGGPTGPPRPLVAWAVTLLTTLILVALYLGPFVKDPGRVPSGLDTPGYVYRARSVSELGLDRLPDFRDRPGHPVLVSVLRDGTRASPLDLARIWPAVIATSLGLAAVGLGRIGLRERLPMATALGLGIAGSAFVALTAIGYAANLLVDLFLVAAMALAFHVLRGGEGLAGLGLLIAAAAVTHWLFALVMVGLLLVVALAGSLWPLAQDPPDPGRHARRLLRGLGVGTVLGGLALLLAPGLPTAIVRQSFTGDVDRRIGRRLPLLSLPWTVAGAAVGAIAIATLGGSRHRRTLPALVAWAALAPAGLVAWYGLHLRVPPYRTAAVALGVPVLIVLGAASPASALLDRGRRLARAIAGLLVVAACAWLVVGGTTAWWSSEPAVGRDDLAEAAALDAYLATLPPGTPAVVPLPHGAARPPRILRLGMGAARADAVSLVPTDLSSGMDAFVGEVLQARPAGTVVVFLDAYRRPPPGIGSRLAPGVTLVRGPSPSERLLPLGVDADATDLVRATALAFALLVIAGLGWTLALAELRIAEAVTLSPAIGAAALVIGGLVAGRLGVPYAGGGGIAIAALTSATGWGAWISRRAWTARRGRSGSPRARGADDG